MACGAASKLILCGIWARMPTGWALVVVEQRGWILLRATEYTPAEACGFLSSNCYRDKQTHTFVDHQLAWLTSAPGKAFNKFLGVGDLLNLLSSHGMLATFLPNCFVCCASTSPA